MEQIRKTKIICTLGPATDSEEVMRGLLESGMNVARFNFSHGDHKEHLARLQMLRKLREQMGLPVAALLDTKGPEVRTGRFKDGKVEVKDGQTFTLTTRDIEGDEHGVSITYKGLPGDVEVGMHILIDDGNIDTIIESKTDTDIVCRVINGGTIATKKGVNIPQAHLSMDYISAKDYKDIVFGVKEGYDVIAASFVRSADDIMKLKEVLAEHGGEKMRVIAKIENREGVENIDEIIKVTDGIMVARGDMGVEIPLEDVPVIQKVIIQKVYAAGKVVITATQMLDSMMSHPRPTRAEANDVANAIYDGTSAIMLSGETAAGKYPIESLQTMVRIALRTERDIHYLKRLKMREPEENPNITDGISHSACLLAGQLGAKAIIAVTKSGRTVHMISKYRPHCPIIGGCMTQQKWRQLNMSWGVIPLLLEEKQNAEELFEHAVRMAQKEHMVEEGDVVVLTAGVPVGMSGTTNMLKAEMV